MKVAGELSKVLQMAQYHLGSVYSAIRERTARDGLEAQTAEDREVYRAVRNEIHELRQMLRKHLYSTYAAVTRTSALYDWKMIDRHRFEYEFHQIHPEFRQKLLGRYGWFSETQLRILMLLKLRIPHHMIATIVWISEKDLDIHCYRLRRRIAGEDAGSLRDLIDAV